MMNFQQIILKLGIDLQEFTLQFNSHPNYPSALAFSDTLNFLGVSNEAYELDKQYWEELSEEFITIYKSDFTLVKRTGSKATVFTDNEKTIPFDDLKKNSENFILLFERKIQNRIPYKENLLQAILLIIVVVIFFINVFLEWSLWNFIFQMLSFAAVYMFFEIFQERSGKESPILQNFCGAPVTTAADSSSCKTIFRSKDLHLFGLTFSDLGFIYFIGLMTLPLFVQQDNIIFSVLSSVSLLSVFYSIYYQISKKSFCRICVVILVILISQFFISIFMFKSELIYSDLLKSVFVFTAAFLIVHNLVKSTEEKERCKKENIKKPQIQKRLRYL